MNKKNVKLETDFYGYLINFNSWNKDFANKIAYKENINLNKIHWKLINFLRTFYKEFKVIPGVRIMVTFLSNKYKNKNIDSRYILRLFPKGPINQAIKIAGLPKPIKCFF
ncbi:TusE/DsrC/DsvC family sulfur relay protein [Sodalis-like secondary symbiont of Drepanosiphum platanoidis]|uniref:TusE/DsrC/DsvC family sulfur relay protein n=1 Tax=Sodalis-like secondary symbiont of Drepanosiphum platanoidis TaxID=2994493 RepID=UPI003464D7BD